ncbi:hypothetical protein DFH07DRAFT_70417 [Mycena maculata]|uniref:Uncharacterized protein n=1 Tax=Mycena maculata TaxID=230809 RepID=A0AAD7IDM3_9AGAR|nr:hypothetical protein DFH07DRAFT_70417 [Mycena maculata]
MNDAQWCLDECANCATVVEGPSIYCPQCEPDVKEEEAELEDGYAPYTPRTTVRVSAWALDCYKSTRVAPASGPYIVPSPSRRKLHIRKQHPTSWVTPDGFSSSISLSSPMSTPTAVESESESAATSATIPPSPISRCPARSWAAVSPASATRPLLTKTNVYLSSSSKAHAPPLIEPSDCPANPSGPGSWRAPSDAAAACTRANAPMLKPRRPVDRPANSPFPHIRLPFVL